MAQQYGPLDDEFEYPWLNPNASGTSRSGVLGTPNVSWDGTNFTRNDMGLGGNSWFGKSGILPTAFQGLSALGGLMQAYTGLKGLGVMQDQLETSKDAFRTQFEANKTSLANQGRNASATNYAMHNGLARSFNQDEQNRVADAEYDRINRSYKSYV